MPTLHTTCNGNELTRSFWRHQRTGMHCEKGQIIHVYTAEHTARRTRTSSNTLKLQNRSCQCLDLTKAESLLERLWRWCIADTNRGISIIKKFPSNSEMHVLPLLILPKHVLQITLECFQTNSYQTSNYCFIT